MILHKRVINFDFLVDTYLSSPLAVYEIMWMPLVWIISSLTMISKIIKNISLSDRSCKIRGRYKRISSYYVLKIFRLFTLPKTAKPGSQIYPKLDSHSATRPTQIKSHFCKCSPTRRSRQGLVLIRFIKC